MAFIKVIPPGSYDFKEPTTQLVKVASSGLRGNDLREFIKRAGHGFADAVRRMDLKSGDIPVHVIALGATEFYGPNRNGDGFKEATCRQHFKTFEKHARWYRNHANKNPDKSFGRIKHADFNDPMKRIELIAVLNGTKEAADRNGGLVADEELKKLEEGRDIPVSMACKVAYDICAACNNKARNKAEYCTGEDEGGHCKRGGVKNRMTFVHDDGFINHVDNPNPLWFDLSNVFRGADRIAFTNGIVKAASGLSIGGAELAEKLGLEMPLWLNDGMSIGSTRLEKLASKLADYEQQYTSGQGTPYDKALCVQEEYDWSPNVLLKQALASLAAFNAFPPFDGWVKLAGHDLSSEQCSLARRQLPGVYGRMLTSGEINEKNLSPYVPCGNVHTELLKWASNVAEAYAMDEASVINRIKRANLYSISVPKPQQAPLIKLAGTIDTLVKNYSLCKLAMLQAVVDRIVNPELTISMVTRQNYLC